MTKNKGTDGDEIDDYIRSQKKDFAEICRVLRDEIDKALSKSTSRIYYSAPVWFLDDNPIVGFNATSKYVNLLFWSGKSFEEPGLAAAGKFKAAQVKYQDLKEVDVKALRRWLKKSKVRIWDYKNLRKNEGKLGPVT
jgi:hypothetical protein